MAKEMMPPIRIVDDLTESNCYILEDHGKALLIDPNDYGSIKDHLDGRGLIPEWILLTHEHCDHIAALNELRRHYSLQVLASADCSRGIQDTKLNMTRIMEAYLFFKNKGTSYVTYPKFVCQAADVTFDRALDFGWHNHILRLLPAPGHTPGSTCIILDEKLLFSGDYFIPGEEVITRLPGGDEEVYEKIGKKVLRSLPNDIRTYPGHGEAFILTTEVKNNYGL
jgi:glyoxylase-like metal-dependent hydrolase (beta-lactamase superfamily II)